MVKLDCGCVLVLQAQGVVVDLRKPNALQLRIDWCGTHRHAHTAAHLLGQILQEGLTEDLRLRAEETVAAIQKTLPGQ